MDEESHWVNRITSNFAEVSRSSANDEIERDAAVDAEFERSQNDFLVLNIEIQQIRSDIAYLKEEIGEKEENLKSLDQEMKNNVLFIRSVEDRLPEKKLLDAQNRFDKLMAKK